MTDRVVNLCYSLLFSGLLGLLPPPPSFFVLLRPPPSFSKLLRCSPDSFVLLRPSLGPPVSSVLLRSPLYSGLLRLSAASSRVHRSHPSFLRYSLSCSGLLSLLPAFNLRPSPATFGILRLPPSFFIVLWPHPSLLAPPPPINKMG